MLKKANIKLALFYFISIGFILLNLYFVVKKDSLIIGALPFVFCLVLFAIYSFDKIFNLIVFFTPLSIPLSELVPGMSFNMYLPTEPLLFGLLIIFLLKVVADRGFDRELLTHPVSIGIYINLLWILITSITSSMPVVSFKLLLTRVWFIAGFYFIAMKVFEKKQNFEKYIWLYIIPLYAVIAYAWSRHLGYGLWDREAAHFVVNPFYKDHTSYGAILAMYIPFLMGFTFFIYHKTKFRVYSLVTLVVLVVALILSYSRAAWLSLFMVFGVWVIIKLKIRFKTLLISLISFLVFVFAFQTQILMFLERNSEESSTNITQHISSMTNISSDASNLERINRWSCAIRMFEEKPFLGYGPGTYMFKYGPFQLTDERTIISTNSGDGGNAHSEYLGALSESGILGMLTFMLVIGLVIYTGVNAYTRLNDKRLKTIVLSALMGLMTYYIHGLMNNFLDTDKVSAPFWGFTALIVIIDIQSKAGWQKKESLEK